MAVIAKIDFQARYPCRVVSSFRNTRYTIDQTEKKSNQIFIILALLRQYVKRVAGLIYAAYRPANFFSRSAPFKLLKQRFPNFFHIIFEVESIN